MTMKRVFYGFFPCIGLLCIAFPRQITAVLPYILGGAMAAAGIAGMSAVLRRDAAGESDPSVLASGLVLLVIGGVCVYHGEQSIGPLGTTWAIIGIRKAARSLTGLLRDRDRGVGAALHFGGFLVRFTCSVLLLFYPTEKFETHIVLLGLELIAVSIRLTKQRRLSFDLEE